MKKNVNENYVEFDFSMGTVLVICGTVLSVLPKTLGSCSKQYKGN